MSSTLVSTAASTSAQQPFLSTFSSSPNLVGSAWMISSSIFTTYYTTAFLKHGSSLNLPSKKFEELKHGQLAVAMGNASVLNQNGKPLFLSNLSRPKLLTLYRFGGSLLLGLVVNPKLFQLNLRVTHTLIHMKDFLLPAIFLFTANYYNSIALDRIGISLTYTSKCGIPLITVLFTLFLHGFEAMPSAQALLSLVPIAIGIAMASWNSPTFERTGFLAAMMSCTAQAALNVSSKLAMTRTEVSGLEAQRAMSAVAFVIAMGITSLGNIYLNRLGSNDRSKSRGASLQSNFEQNREPPQPPIRLTIGAVAAYHTEYLLSFMFVRLVQPITYGTCDAIRRLAIIISGRQMFGGEAFSTLNFSGIALALLGALSYSISTSK